MESTKIYRAEAKNAEKRTDFEQLRFGSGRLGKSGRTHVPRLAFIPVSARARRKTSISYGRRMAKSFGGLVDDGRFGSSNTVRTAGAPFLREMRIGPIERESENS